MAVRDLKISVPGKSGEGRRGAGGCSGLCPASAPGTHFGLWAAFSLLSRCELQEPEFGGNSQPAPHPRENTRIYFLLIPNPTKPQLLCSLECVNCPALFLLTFRGNFLGLPLFPSPSGCSGAGCLCSLHCSVPQQLLLCVILIMILGTSLQRAGLPTQGLWAQGCAG